LYRYFVSQSSEFCLHNPLCCFSTRVYFCFCCLFLYGSVQKLLDVPLYIVFEATAIQYQPIRTFETLETNRSKAVPIHNFSAADVTGSSGLNSLHTEEAWHSLEYLSAVELNNQILMQGVTKQSDKLRCRF